MGPLSDQINKLQRSLKITKCYTILFSILVLSIDKWIIDIN